MALDVSWCDVPGDPVGMSHVDKRREKLCKSIGALIEGARAMTQPAHHYGFKTQNAAMYCIKSSLRYLR